MDSPAAPHASGDQGVSWLDRLFLPRDRGVEQNRHATAVCHDRAIAACLPVARRRHGPPPPRGDSSSGHPAEPGARAGRGPRGAGDGVRCDAAVDRRDSTAPGRPGSARDGDGRGAAERQGRRRRSSSRHARSAAGGGTLVPALLSVSARQSHSDSFTAPAPAGVYSSGGRAAARLARTRASFRFDLPALIHKQVEKRKDICMATENHSENAQALVEQIRAMRKKIPNFVFPTVKGERRRLSNAASVPAELIELTAVAMKNNAPLVRGQSAGPEGLRDLLSFAPADGRPRARRAPAPCCRSRTRTLRPPMSSRRCPPSSATASPPRGTRREAK